MQNSIKISYKVSIWSDVIYSPKLSIPPSPPLRQQKISRKVAEYQKNYPWEVSWFYNIILYPRLKIFLSQTHLIIIFGQIFHFWTEFCEFIFGQILIIFLIFGPNSSKLVMTHPKLVQLLVFGQMIIHYPGPLILGSTKFQPSNGRIHLFHFYFISARGAVPPESCFNCFSDFKNQKKWFSLNLY